MPSPTELFTVASRANVPPFHVMDLLAAAAERRRTHGDLLDLVAGQPSTPAPAPVRAAAHRALDEEVLGYTVALGIPALREAICAHHRRVHGLDVSPDDVVVTTGSSGGFLLAFLAAFEPGDRVAIARPGYPCYRNVLTALGCEVVELPTGPESRFQPTVEMLDGLDRPVQGLVVASPANPTGTMLAPSELAALARWCEERASGWSATRSTTGSSSLPAPARLGLGDLARGRGLQLVLEVLLHDRLAARLDAGARAPAPSGRRAHRQLHDLPAGARAARRRRGVQRCVVRRVRRARRRYATNRAVLLEGLPRLGIERLAPADGAFYVYADVGHLTDDTMTWCPRLLAETGIATAPGIDFDTATGNRFVRLSFAGATADMKAALDRLEAWL